MMNDDGSFHAPAVVTRSYFPFLLAFIGPSIVSTFSAKSREYTNHCKASHGDFVLAQYQSSLITASV